MGAGEQQVTSQGWTQLWYLAGWLGQMLNGIHFTWDCDTAAVFFKLLPAVAQSEMEKLDQAARRASSEGLCPFWSGVELSQLLNRVQQACSQWLSSSLEQTWGNRRTTSTHLWSFPTSSGLNLQVNFMESTGCCCFRVSLHEVFTCPRSRTFWQDHTFHFKWWQINL